MSAKTNNPRAYLLRGDDDFQKSRHLDKLLKSFVTGDFADFDLEPMEGDSATSDRIITGLNIPPFGSKQRVVLVRHANKMNADEQSRLADKIDTISPTGCLILVNPAAEKVDGKPKKGSEVIGDLSKAVRKVGEVVEFGKMRTDAAIKFAMTAFADAGKKVGSPVAAALVQRVGTDSSVLSTEIQKLVDYSGDSDTITSQDIAAVTSETHEEKIFKLVDAIAAKDQALSLKLLEEVFEFSDDPHAEAPKTLAVIARQFRLIWQMKLLHEMGVRSFAKSDVPDNIKDMLPADTNILDILSKQSWQTERLSRQTKPFSRSNLIRCFGSIAKADQMLKSIDGDMENPEMVMQLLVLELARK